MANDVTYTNDQLENLPLAEIKRLAEEEASKSAAQPEVKAAEALKAEDNPDFDKPTPWEEEEKPQPRGKDGKFASKQEAPQDPEPEEKKVYRRTIKGVDGGADEVFEADSVEALVDKIADAKEHATRKIREQEKELKAKREAERQFTQDEEFIYSQELLKNPTVAFKKLFKDVTGVDIETFKNTQQRSQALVDATDKQSAISTFLTTHPDYVDSEKNGKLMNKWMGGVLTVESFNKAYDDLTASGLLDLKGNEAHAGQEQPKPKAERIAQPKVEEVTSQRTKKGSGVSTQSRPTAGPTNTEPSEDELYDPSKYSLDEIKRRANAQLGKARS